MKLILRTSVVTVLLLWLHLNAAMAQTHPKIVGTVVSSADNTTVPGVTVKVKGSTAGSLTDASGNFSLEAPANAILEFSSIGFVTQEVPLNNQTEIRVKLQVSARELEQVVVVGYGTQRKIDVTGSVARVNGDELSKQPVQTATQALQGKAAGVQIISSGEPNSKPVVRIRGTGTLLAGADPLYVVDGIITDDIRNINTSDIVSVDILKDASSTSIYGMRGANGVILITTKKGIVGKPVFTYNTNIGFREVSNQVKMADATQYVAYLKDATPTTTIPAFTGSTDWFRAILHHGFSQTHTLALSGGSESAKYYVSLGYLKDNGVLIGSNFERFSLNSRLEFTISKKFSASVLVNYSNNNTRAQDNTAASIDGTGNTAGSAYNDAYRAAPIIPATQGALYGNTSAFGNVGNPVLDINSIYARDIQNRIQGGLNLTYSPIPWLKIATTFSPDIRFDNSTQYNYEFLNDQNTFITAGGNQQNPFSTLAITRIYTFGYVWDNTATFNHTFGKHSITLLAGLTTELDKTNDLVGSRRDVPASPDQWYLSAGNSLNEVVTQTGDKYTRRSFLGRVNYAYAGKYLLTASIRNDGTSKFPAGNRTDYFPAVGLGWVISNEEFMKNQSAFNTLKLRASYGKVGNDNIPTSSYVVTGNTFVPYFFAGSPAFGTTITDIKNPNLRWEVTTETDAALEFAFLKNRLTGEIDYYDKQTDNALINVNLPSILGDPDNLYVTNAASFSNKGWEVSLAWRAEAGADFSYHIGANITFNKNRISNLNGGQALLDGGVGQQGFVTKSDNRQPVGSFYVLKALGTFKTQADIDGYVNSGGTKIQPTAQPGDLKYQDVNGDGQITPDDRVYAGSYQPKAYFGINLGLAYKGFDLSADFYGNLGNQIYNGKKAYRYQETDNIEASYAAKRWTSSNTTSNDPRIIDASTPASTYFIESGNFIRLNNLTIGYNLPKEMLAKAKIGNIRFFLTSQNLFTLKKFSGFSPELPGSPLNSGIELNAYPTTRTLAFGINASF